VIATILAVTFIASLIVTASHRSASPEPTA